MPAYPWSRSPPTAPPGCAAPAPTRPPTRCGSSATRPASPTSTAPDPDALDAAWLPGGPVHLNCQFDDPLIPDPDSPSTIAPMLTRRVERSERSDYPWRRSGRRPTPTRSPLGPRTVVVAGDDAGPPARMLAEQAGWPLLAEPSSGSRTGDEPDPHLPAAARHRPRRAHRAGRRVRAPDAVAAGEAAARRATTSRWSRCARTAAGPTGPFPVASEHDAVTAEADDPAWLEEWRDGRPGARSRGSTRSWREQPGLTPYDVARGRQRRQPAGRPARRRAPATRSATST